MKRYQPPLLLFAVALSLRLLYLWEIADNPFFTSPVVDAHTYAQQARAIAQGHWLDYTPDPFWQPPLYPWFLGAVCALAGERFLLVARLLQALGGALACVLLYLLGRRLFSPRLGLAAGALLAAYGPAIYFDGELLPASVALLFFLALLLSALWAKAHLRRWFLTGLLLGAAALNVATFLVLAPCLLAWIWRTHPAPLRAAARFGAGCLLAIAPVTARNYAFSGDFVLISWNSGINFFIGNNPEYPRTVQIRPGQAWLDLMARAPATGAANSRFFFGEAWRYIRAHPLDWAALLAEKAAAFWSGDEPGRNQNLYYLRNYSRLLSALMWKDGLAFPFGLIAPLALIGIALALPQRGAPRLLLAAVLSYAAGVALFFVTARYRLPAVPGLLLLAALALAHLAGQVRQRRPAVLGWLGAVALLTAWSNRGLGDMGMEGDAEVYYNLGHAYIEQQRLGEGIRALERAAELAPDDADILFSLGTACEWAGDHGRAVQILARAAQLYPGRVDIRLNLGNAYFQSQLYAQAAAEYRVVLRAHPDHLETLRSAARAAARAGQSDTAIVYYQQLRHREPRTLEPCLALGYFHRQTGRPEEALRHYQEALDLEPDHLTALLESGLIRLEQGEPGPALALFQRAAQRHPRSAQAHDHLGRVYQRQGRLLEAAAAWRQSLQLDPAYSGMRDRLDSLYRQME